MSKLKKSKKYSIEDHVKSLVYGGIDGIITTFAVVTGAAGATLSSGVIIILGFANLIADGISMAVGDYLSSKSQKEHEEKQRNNKIKNIDNNEESEKKQTTKILENKGFSNNDANKITSIFSNNKKAWIDFKSKFELNLSEDEQSPLKNSITTFLSFVFFGFMPLLIYVIAIFINIETSTKLTISVILTGLTMFLLGALKSIFSTKHWFRSGIEIVIVGGIAASAAFIVGNLLRGLA